MTRSNIIILISVIGVGILAYVIYAQAVKKKKLINDTERLFKESLTPTATPTPTTTTAPAPTQEQINATIGQNFPILAPTPPGGGVFAPDYDNSGLGFMPGTSFKNYN